jgi:hypothetical protein
MLGKQLLNEDCCWGEKKEKPTARQTFPRQHFTLTKD